MCKLIYLTNRKDITVIVDDEDHEHLSQWNWFYSSRYIVRYAGREGNIVKTLPIHQQILNPDKIHGMVVDHINGNPFDNRKVNLRLCTQTDNRRNSRKCSKETSSRFKGVSRHIRKNRWQVNVKGIFGGLYNKEYDAAQAYNFLALKHFGDFAKFNKDIPHA